MILLLARPRGMPARDGSAQHQDQPQVVDERQPQQAGPGPDLDRPRRVAEVDGSRIAAATAPARSRRSSLSQSRARSSNVAMSLP